MMPTSHPVAAHKSYDLYLGFGGKRFVWTNPNHGVTLADDSIAWSAGGREWQARLRDIAAVHLGTGNVGADTIASCRLRFSNGMALLIASSNSHGVQDDTLDRLYAEFVHDLHARLAAIKDVRTTFTAGVSDARYRFGKVVVVLAGLLFIVTPTVLLLMTRELQMAWALYAGVVLVWPVYRVIKANAPRNYDPRHIPPELCPSTRAAFPAGAAT